MLTIPNRALSNSQSLKDITKKIKSSSQRIPEFYGVMNKIGWLEFYKIEVSKIKFKD